MGGESSCCCSASEQADQEAQLQLSELDVLRLTKIPDDQFLRQNVTFSFRNGQMVNVRTFIFSDEKVFKFDDLEHEKRTKPTLLMIHGFGGSAPLCYPIYKLLLDHFRIVAIDMLGYGSSSRVEIKEEVLSFPSATDTFQVSWLTAWLNQMSLNSEMPEKFFLHGHSYGGYVSSIFACAHPDRIAGLFLNSAIGAEAEPPEYDPHKIRLSSFDKGPPPDYIARFWKNEWENQRTPLDTFRALPNCIADRLGTFAVNRDLEYYPVRHCEIVKRYYMNVLKLGSSGTEKALTATFKYGCYPYHCLTEVDRLGNPNLPFPVAFCYGDQDWLGTAGADKIVEGNKFFADGISQIFILEGSDHVTYLDNPNQLCRYIIGFFKQTIKHNFKTKERSTIKENYVRRISIKKPYIVITEELKSPERRQKTYGTSTPIQPKMFDESHSMTNATAQGGSESQARPGIRRVGTQHSN